MCGRVCVCMFQYFCNYLLDLLPLEHRHKSPPTRNSTNHPTNISLQGQKSKGTLKPGKRRAQVEQVKKKKRTMKRQRNTPQVKGKEATHKTR